MISKGLLSEVSGIEIKDVTICGTSVCYNKTSAILGRVLKGCGYFEGSINIYALAHKCKEWALEYGYVLYSAIMLSTDSYKHSCFIPDSIIMGTKRWYAGTEPEAIFKACEWILDNKGIS